MISCTCRLKITLSYYKDFEDNQIVFINTLKYAMNFVVNTAR